MATRDPTTITPKQPLLTLSEETKSAQQDSLLKTSRNWWTMKDVLVATNSGMSVDRILQGKSGSQTNNVQQVKGNLSSPMLQLQIHLQDISTHGLAVTPAKTNLFSKTLSKHSIVGITSFTMNPGRATRLSLIKWPQSKLCKNKNKWNWTSSCAVKQLKMDKDKIVKHNKDD